MGFFGKMKNYFVGEDVNEDDYSTIYEEYNETESVPTEKRNREVKIAATTTLQIVLARPTDYSEVKSIGDDLNDQKTVLLNLETVKPDDAKRILDFLSGVAYANGADIKMMAQKTFAIMPRNVGFSGVDLMSELESNGYSF
ncbi:MAG: cell division protein SepF [Clostridiales bacterium]|nr:cell division protein SepF [Clostridiales bacterium]